MAQKNEPVSEPEVVDVVAETPDKAVEEPVALDPFVFTSEDLLASGLVEGIGDAAILQGASNVDLLDRITYNKEVITDISLDISGLDIDAEATEASADATAEAALPAEDEAETAEAAVENASPLPFDTEGALDAAYVVPLSGKALTEYLSLTENDGVALPDDEVVVEVPVVITVISPDSAAEWLTAHSDSIILMDGNEVYDPLAPVELEAEAEHASEPDGEAETDNTQPVEIENTDGKVTSAATLPRPS